MNKFEKILFVSLFFIIVIFGIAFLFQQNTIKQLKASVENKKNVAIQNEDKQEAINSGVKGDISSDKDAQASIESSKKYLLENTKYIVGEITRVDNGILTISTKILDLSKFKDGYIPKNPNDYTKDKTYRVSFDNKTIFSSLNQSDLRPGLSVQAISDNPILEVDEFYAKELTTKFRLGNE